ncbi:MAG: HD family phosphohydrolase [Anaerolineae bacterium]
MNDPASGAINPQAARRERVVSSPLRRALRGLLYALLLTVLLSATLVLYPSSDRANFIVGEPSPILYKAPRQISYMSDVQTQAARELAASQVNEVFTGPDIVLASQRVKQLQNITSYITALRNDLYSSYDERFQLVSRIPNLTLSSAAIQNLLQLSDVDWEKTAQEASRVLDLVMREEIRINQVNYAQRQITRYSSYSLSDSQTVCVFDLCSAMVVPNTLYDAAQTATNRQAAADAVKPVLWTIRDGESIVREGEIVTELMLENLQALGLLESEANWQTQLGLIAMAIALVIALSYYIYRTQPLLLARPRREFMLVLLLASFAAATRFLIPGHTLTPYLFPIAAMAMFTTLLLDLNLAIFMSAIGAIFVGYHSGGSLELSIYALLGGVVGALALWKMDSLVGFARAMLYITLMNLLVIVAFRLRSQTIDITGLVQLLISGVGNAVLASSVTFVAFAFIGRIFGITTSLQLLELARPTHPLFRQLLIKAPGTYHHSIVISNMAERASEVIGADSLLARVGSYYHDIGKTVRPFYFSENQGDGDNPHDQLDPKTSAETILAHVTDGLELARKYAIPDKVVDFIPEHHGTTLVAYFYRRAVQESENDIVDESAFRYSGPKPQTKETAIVMLADSVEALVRASHPTTQVEVERLIRQIINDRLVSGQLDECDLTLRDLDKIRQAFVGVLQGVFHPRIQYPERSEKRGMSRTERLQKHEEEASRDQAQG